MAGLSAEAIKRTNVATQKLSCCATEAQINKVFSDYDVKTPEAKSALLRASMGVKDVFMCSGTEENAVQNYQDDLFMFLDGTWRLLQ
jgi:hypothetical protein